MKRIISLILLFSLLLSCFACGQREQPDTDISPAPLQTAPQVPAAPDSENSEDPPPLPASPKEEPAGPAVTEPVPEEPYVRSIDPSKPMVALTFDDGPHETYSDLILDILEENHSVATFFEVGRNVAAYPEPVQRMVELGCEVASHTNRHPDLTTLSHQGMLDELARADNAFISAIGYAPLLVRPPYGAVNKAVKTGSGRCMVTWTIDTQDWLSRDAATVVEYVQTQPNLDGEVILLHSIHESTVQAVEQLIPWLVQEGYQLVTVSQLLVAKTGNLPEPGLEYYTATKTLDR